MTASFLRSGRGHPATVVVVGSINVDFFTYVDRLPRPGETVIGGSFSRAHGGKGANQAVAAARLGADVVFVGMVGDDDLGRDAVDEMGNEGVILDAVRTCSNHTGVAQILVDAHGENLIAVASGANSEVGADMVTEALGRIDAPDTVVGAVLEIPDEAVIAAATVASDRGWKFVLNPAPARPLSAELLCLCDVLTPNEVELSDLGVASPAELLDSGAGAVVVTRGAAGADLMRTEAPDYHQPVFEVDAVDTTGAGDAFSGALVWALANGRELVSALEVAAAAAALSTRVQGARAGMPTWAEVEAMLKSSRGAE